MKTKNNNKKKKIGKEIAFILRPKKSTNELWCKGTSWLEREQKKTLAKKVKWWHKLKKVERGKTYKINSKRSKGK